MDIADNIKFYIMNKGDYIMKRKLIIFILIITITATSCNTNPVSVTISSSLTQSPDLSQMPSETVVETPLTGISTSPNPLMTTDDERWYDWDITGSPPIYNTGIGFSIKITSDEENIYFFEDDEKKNELNLIKASYDGSNRVIIDRNKGEKNSFFTNNIIYYNNWIYYSIDNAFYKIKPDGSGKTKIYEGISPIYSFLIIDGKYYFQDDDTGLLSYYDETGEIIGYDYMESEFLYYDNGNLYYLHYLGNDDNNYFLMALDLNNNQSLKIDYNINTDYLGYPNFIIYKGIIYAQKDPYLIECYDINNNKTEKVSLNGFKFMHNPCAYKHSILFIAEGKDKNIDYLIQFDIKSKIITKLCDIPANIFEIYPTRIGVYLADNNSYYVLKFDNQEYKVVPLEE